MNTLLLFASSWWDAPEITWPRVADTAVIAVMLIGLAWIDTCRRRCRCDKSED